jgi:hypothetical protein
MSGNTDYLDRIETSYQPLDFSFHPNRDHLLAAALVDGTLEGTVHERNVMHSWL